MSYDVEVSFEDHSPGADELREYVRRHRWFELGDGRAEYADIDTGVVFEFAWADADPVEAVTFELQLGRPTVYGREVAEELEAFADAFDARLDVEQIRSEWDAANRDAFEEGDIEHTVADEQLEAAWRWNRVRRELMEELGGSTFVPRILFFRADGAIRRGVVWPDAIPLALPEVDFVLVSVPEHAAPSQDASRAHRVPYEEFVEAAEPVVDEHDDPVAHLQLLWSEAPTDVVETITSEANVAEADDLTGLAIDRIFEASLFPED